MSAAHGPDSKAHLLAQQGVWHPYPEQVQDVLFRGGLFFDAHDLIHVHHEIIRGIRSSRTIHENTVRTNSVHQLVSGQATRTSPDIYPAVVPPNSRGPTVGLHLSMAFAIASVAARATITSLSAPSTCRFRAVLACLLEGDLDKQVAARLGGRSTR